MNCDEIGRRTPDLLAGNLTEEAARLAGEHLAACSACRAEVESLGRIWQRLGLVPDEEPSERLRARFYSALAQIERREADAARPPAWKRWRDALEGWWLEPVVRRAVAVGASLAVGLLLGVTLAGRSSRAEVVEMRSQVEDLRELVAVSMLRQDSATARLQGVSYGRQVAAADDRVVEALVDAATADPSANVRLAAIEALAALDTGPAVRGRLAASLDETTTPLVQLAVVDLLLGQGGPEAGDLLRGRTLDESVREYLENQNPAATY